ncbi:MAG: hypothetical protein NVS1B7_1640 [Candidatus Saccharimonadales bacterium]
MKFTTNAKRREYRLAVVVSKKISKSAVVRNRIRRRLFEAMRLEQEKLNAAYDIVITVFSIEVVNLSSEEIRTMIGAQLKQGRLI